MANEIDIDVSQAVSDLRRQFSNLSTYKTNLAIARALNHTIAKGKTAARKEVRGQYKVKIGEINRSLKVVKATAATQTAYIKVSARPLRIIAFGARQTKKGVTVNVMGKRKLIKSAFIANMKSGHRGVFVRGRYQGTELTYRTKRINKKGPDLPIEEVNTASVFSMITNKTVQNKVAETLNTSFAARLLHEMQRLA